MPSDYRLAEYVRTKYETSNMMSLYLTERRLDIYKTMGLLGVIGFSSTLIAVFVFRAVSRVVDASNIKDGELDADYIIKSILRDLIFVSLAAFPVSIIDTLLQFVHADFNMDSMLFCLKYSGLNTDNIPVTSAVSAPKDGTMTFMTSYKDGTAYMFLTVIMIAAITGIAILEESRKTQS